MSIQNHFHCGDEMKMKVAPPPWGPHFGPQNELKTESKSGPIVWTEFDASGRNSRFRPKGPIPSEGREFRPRSKFRPTNSVRRPGRNNSVRGRNPDGIIPSRTTDGRRPISRASFRFRPDGIIPSRTMDGRRPLSQLRPGRNDSVHGRNHVVQFRPPDDATPSSDGIPPSRNSVRRPGR